MTFQPCHGQTAIHVRYILPFTITEPQEHLILIKPK